MDCLLEPTKNTDLVCLVSGQVFSEAVDPDDLRQRVSAKIEDVYCRAWFYSRDGFSYFIPPAFELRNGAAYGINGRHRALLLARHLSALPMLITRCDDRSRQLFDRLVVREIATGEAVVLPDLPLRDCPPD